MECVRKDCVRAKCFRQMRNVCMCLPPGGALIMLKCGHSCAGGATLIGREREWGRGTGSLTMQMQSNFDCAAAALLAHPLRTQQRQRQHLETVSQSPSTDRNRQHPKGCQRGVGGEVAVEAEGGKSRESKPFIQVCSRNLWRW